MNLYLNHGDSSSDLRFLSQNQPELTGYAYAPDIENQFTTLEFEAPLLPGFILHNGQLNIVLTFSKNGELTIAPTLYLRDSDPSTEDRLIWSGIRRATPEAPQRMSWSDSISDIADLHDYKIVLKLEIGNVTGFTSSSLTFAKDSNIEPDIREGSRDYGDIVHNVVFSVYQKREWGNIYTSFDVRFSESGQIYHDSIFSSEETGNLYDVYTLYKQTEGNIALDADLLPLSSLADKPQISNLSLGVEYPRQSPEKRTLRGRDLKTVHNLYDVSSKFDNLPEVIVPPETHTYPGTGVVEISAFVGEPAGYVIEDLLLSNGNFISGDSVKVFTPSSLYGGTYQYRDEEYGSGEWQLPDSFTDQDYYITFPCEPFISENTFIRRSSGVWFYLREREVGANTIAYLNGVAGSLVFFKELSPEQNLNVWYWRGAAAPFDVHLYVNNPVLNLPGFAGKSAGIVVS